MISLSPLSPLVTAIEFFHDMRPFQDTALDHSHEQA